MKQKCKQLQERMKLNIVDYSRKCFRGGHPQRNPILQVVCCCIYCLLSRISFLTARPPHDRIICLHLLGNNCLNLHLWLCVALLYEGLSKAAISSANGLEPADTHINA